MLLPFILYKNLSHMLEVLLSLELILAHNQHPHAACESHSHELTELNTGSGMDLKIDAECTDVLL